MARQRRLNRTWAFCAAGALASGEEANMYEVYVLKSYKDGIRYIGSGNNAEERLRRHNKGDYRFSKGHRPWHLIYKENFTTRSEAMRREKFLKSVQGRKFLDNVIGRAGGSSNGRTPAFEAVNRGPNPCPPALPKDMI
jgi:putative endonuclease